MILIFLLILLVSNTLASPIKLCPGMNIAVNKEKLITSFKPAFDNAKKAIENTKEYSNISKSFIDSLRLFFNITNVKATNLKVTIPAVTDINFGETNVTFNLGNNFLVGNFTASYSFSLFGIRIFYGTTSIDVSSKKAVFIQKFEGCNVKTVVDIETDVAIKSISGWNLFNGIGYWLKTLMGQEYLAKIFAPAGVAFNNETMDKIYGKWFNYFPVKDPDLHLRFHNHLDHIYSEKAYINFCFITDVGIEKRPYSKIIYKGEVKTAIDENKLGRVCVPHSVLMAASDITGKARYYMRSIDPKTVRLSTQLHNFLQIMPKLQERHNQNEGLTIGCRTNSAYTFLYKPTTSLDQGFLQIPILCQFGAKKNGENFLDLEFIVRSAYKIIANKTKVDIVLNDTKLYNFKYSHAVVPVEDEMSLQRIALLLADKLKDKQLYKKSLEFALNFGESDNVQVKEENNQHCFTFDN